ncbi:MAG TPA: ATP-dependent Clp protease proteolytic subunit [Acidimicrobiales bacterium]
MQLQRVPGEPLDPGDEAAARLLGHGVVLVTGPLDDERVATTMARVLTLTAAGDRDTITVHLSNVGGSVSAGLALHDVIAGAPATVAVTAAGMLETAGALVLRAGTAGHRTLLPSARVHLRRPDEPETAGVDLESGAREVAHLREAAVAALGTPLHPSRLLTAKEAVEAGLADQVAAVRSART